MTFGVSNTPITVSGLLGAHSTVGVKTDVSGQGVVDSAGNCEIDIPSPPSGSYYTGTVTVYDSIGTITWAVQINDTTVDITVGQASASGIQIGARDILKLTNQNGSTQQVKGTVFHATFSVLQTPADNTQLIIPGHDTLSPVNSFAPRTIYSTTNTGAFSAPANRQTVVGVWSTAGYESLYVEFCNNFGQVGLEWEFWHLTTGVLNLGSPTNIIQLMPTTFHKVRVGIPTATIVPCLGPYFAIVVNNTNATAVGSCYLSIQGLPSSPPFWPYLPSVVLFNIQNTAIPVGNTSFLPSSPLGNPIVPGRYHLWFQSSVTPGQVSIMQYNANFGVDTYQITEQFNMPAAATNVNVDITLSGDDFQIIVANAFTAAGTIYMTLVGPTA